MADSSIMKIDSGNSPKMKNGKKFLASGTQLSMRMWEDEQPNENKEAHSSPYETVGFVLKGKAELHSEGQVVTLEPGDSYMVPKDAKHTYKILEPFTAVEATAPPSQVHGRE
jgi:quercetin dioxygenase-like cupin family protein